ncbi:MAG: ABC transporter substrate-binding protein [Lachnospiraceae bacterium]|nr:ABC transporter substrate-binding protein [Lachnospiraceae bacterium]
MKKKSRVLALVLAAVVALTACGGQGGKGGDKSGELKDLYTFEVAQREMENVFILNTEMANDLNVLCNTQEGLLETDPKGQLAPAVAEKWETTDGGLTWTFNLRKGVKWVDVKGNEKADCTAQDWLTGLEWVMNSWKNEAKNTSMPTALIKGAGDYYNYTKDLKKEEAMALNADKGSKFQEMVGIEAPDDYTLVYHCTDNAPYFATVATSACLYPLSQALIDELGGTDKVRSANNEKLWYNGPYTLTSYIQGNEKILTKNKSYWDKDAKLFNTVTIKITEDTMAAYKLYETGELDHADLDESTVRKIADDKDNEFHDQLVEKLPRKYSYQMHWNYDKRNEDGSSDKNWNTAVANEAFRQSIYWGLDLTKYWSRTNYVNPLHCENVAYTMKGLLYTSDGTEYTKLVTDKIGLPESDGKSPRRYDKEKALAYKKQAMEELKAKGVTFPIEIDYYIIGGSQVAQDGATVLAETFAETLGDDYVKLKVDTYVSSNTKEVIEPRLQSFTINGWGADYGDPQNYLGQETYGEDGAYYSNNYSNINDAKDKELIATYKEFTKMVNKANKITDDMDKRYDAYAEAEAFMLNHALTVPANLEVALQLTHVNDYTKTNAMYGICNYKYKNWTTSAEAYTAEQYEKFAEEANK